MAFFFHYNGAVLGNWVTISDWRRLLAKLRQRQAGATLRRARQKRCGRTSSAWEEQRSSPPVHWWNIPAVRRHQNRCVSGDPQVGHRQYIAGKYLAGRTGLVALSLCCGAGGKEREWASLGCFSRIDAFDLSPELVRSAQETAAHDSWAAVLRFFVADARSFAATENHYDLVIAEDALHHLAPMAAMLEKIHGWLRPGGIFVLDDFVGPSRFQWRPRQVAAAAALLRLLPERLRRTWDGSQKKRIDVPGRLRMLLADPSEAAESAAIRPLLGRYFEVLEVKERGGTIVNLVFDGIAHHFRGDDPEADAYLNLFLDLEQRLLASREIASDFILALCRKPAAAVQP